MPYCHNRVVVLLALMILVGAIRSLWKVKHPDEVWGYLVLRNGVRLLAARLDNVPVKALREVMDDVRSRLSENAVACLATVEEGKVGMLIYVSKDLHGRFTAPALIKPVAAPCGGAGGGGAVYCRHFCGESLFRFGALSYAEFVVKHWI